MRAELTSALESALQALGVEAPASIHLEQPARREHGDFSSNVALTSAKAAGRPPRELAQAVVDHIAAAPPAHVVGVEVAGPGFVNFRLDDAWLLDLVPTVVQAGSDYGRSTSGDGRRVMVEFVSANPTGPVHAGHARGAVFGDSLARLLEFTGHDVAREFYINDRGVQMQTFAESLAARRAGEEPPEGGYHGEYITEWAAQMPADADPLEWGEAHALEDQRRVLARMNVEYETWFSERAMVDTGAIDTTLADLRSRGVAYDADGAVWLPPPTSATTRTGCSSRATVSTPTCCPTSPTTATSSPAASTCSSTCGARITTATCRACAPRCRRSATTPPTSRSSSPSWSASSRTAKR
jgi:arginyl-tRNA synthetase